MAGISQRAGKGHKQRCAGTDLRRLRLFRDKVKSTPLYDVPHKATPTLEEWTAVTSDEVDMLISSALCKSCQLNPAPTWLMKDIRTLLSPFISLLFNKSLASAAIRHCSWRLWCALCWTGRRRDEKLQTCVEYPVSV